MKEGSFWNAAEDPLSFFKGSIEKNEVAIDTNKVSFSIMFNQSSWQYSWRSTRWDSSIQHVFAVYVFLAELDGALMPMRRDNNLIVHAVSDSFSLVSARRAGKLVKNTSSGCSYSNGGNVRMTELSFKPASSVLGMDILMATSCSALRPSSALSTLRSDSVEQINKNKRCRAQNESTSKSFRKPVKSGAFSPALLNEELLLSDNKEVTFNLGDSLDICNLFSPSIDFWTEDPRPRLLPSSEYPKSLTTPCPTFSKSFCNIDDFLFTNLDDMHSSEL